ncbi:MAG: ATP-binding protein [Phormidesmis sp.]
MHCLLILIEVAIAHLIHGFIGSGKTTYATQLENDLPALRFSIDEWMIALYGQDPPESDFAEYHSRTADLIWKVATRALELGQDVILDFGFWSRTSRDNARARLSRAGAGYVFYYVTCADEVMKARTLNRTEAIPEHALYINEEAIDSLRERFEPLGCDESCKVVCTD